MDKGKNDIFIWIHKTKLDVITMAQFPMKNECLVLLPYWFRANFLNKRIDIPREIVVSPFIHRDKIHQGQFLQLTRPWNTILELYQQAQADSSENPLEVDSEMQFLNCNNDNSPTLLVFFLLFRNDQSCFTVKQIVCCHLARLPYHDDLLSLSKSKTHA